MDANMQTNKPQVNEEVSQGTFRDSDLLVAMTECLKKYAHIQYAELIDEAEQITAKYGDFGYLSTLTDKVDVQDLDTIVWIINEDLYTAMQDIAPLDCYFGAHPGNGSLLGFWPIDWE